MALWGDEFLAPDKEAISPPPYFYRGACINEVNYIYEIVGEFLVITLRSYSYTCGPAHGYLGQVIFNFNLHTD